jgi:hypothetical protein
LVDAFGVKDVCAVARHLPHQALAEGLGTNNASHRPIKVWPQFVGGGNVLNKLFLKTDATRTYVIFDMATGNCVSERHCSIQQHVHHFVTKLVAQHG